MVFNWQVLSSFSPIQVSQLYLTKQNCWLTARQKGSGLGSLSISNEIKVLQCLALNYWTSLVGNHSLAEPRVCKLSSSNLYPSTPILAIPCKNRLCYIFLNYINEVICFYVDQGIIIFQEEFKFTFLQVERRNFVQSIVWLLIARKAIKIEQYMLSVCVHVCFCVLIEELFSVWLEFTFFWKPIHILACWKTCAVWVEFARLIINHWDRNVIKTEVVTKECFLG